MAKKISAEDLLKQMSTPGARIEDFAQYFKIDPDAAQPFGMQVVYDPDKVDMGATAEAMRRAALALPGFNTIVRASRRAQFELKLLGGYSGPILVAEGDSWFTYPRLDVVGKLNDTYAVSHLAAAGDTLQQMLAQDEYLHELRRLDEARILLLSAGGNDALGGGDLKTHLRPFDKTLSAAQHVKSSFNALVDSAIAQFDGIYRRIAREAPGVTVITHGYDYAIPDNGKWLGKPMTALGIKDKLFQRAVAAELMDRFTVAMTRLAEKHPHVVFLDNRGVVAADEWADELHPKPAGFTKIAARFDTAIKAAVAKPRKRGLARSTTRRGVRSPTGQNTGMSLHIGLNKVDPGHYGSEMELFGCHRDAEAMDAIAKAAGYDDRVILLDGQATEVAVRTRILQAAKALQAGDIFLLTYAGHGSTIDDFSGDELDHGRDSTWCLFDRQMLDDELYDHWHHFREGVRVLVVSDSCHSGTMIRSTAQGMVRVEVGTKGEWPRPRALPESVARDVNRRHVDLYKGIARALGDDAGKSGGLRRKKQRELTRPLSCAVRLLAACQDRQTAADGDMNGLFTSRLLQVLERQFRGDYDDFFQAIEALMPTDQVPNHWTVGRADPAFDAQHPFEI